MIIQDFGRLKFESRLEESIELSIKSCLNNLSTISRLQLTFERTGLAG
jgi:hypothetical protein